MNEAPAALRVLVVDDRPDTRASLRLLVTAWGHEVAEAADGPSALAVAGAYRPDAVLLDVGLPGLDGYEVARRLRGLPGLGDTFLLAQTGYGTPDEVERCLRAGFDLHLLKPVDPDRLRRLLEVCRAWGRP
jgi:CheY-like chemotaxis protein